MIRIRIERDGKTMMEFLLNEDMKRAVEELKGEVKNMEENIEEIIGLYKAFSNETRLKMFLDFVEEGRKRFKEFLEDRKLNPKIVSSNLDAFRRIGLIRRGRDREYLLSPLGIWAFVATVILRRMMSELKRGKGREWRRIRVE